MTKVLIVGGNGQLARIATRRLLAHTDARLTLYLRRAKRLTSPDPSPGWRSLKLTLTPGLHVRCSLGVSRA